MALVKTLRTHPDGSPHWNDDGSPHWMWHSDTPGEQLHVIKTGPIKAHAYTSDGTVYDLSPDYIAAPLEHHAELSHLIGKWYEENGHPLDRDGVGFTHVCSDHCGRFAETPPIQMALASSVAENAALNGLAGTGSTNVMPFMSLHTASPGTTGANENANTGSYARQSSTWGTASGGTIVTSNGQTFSTAGTVAVTAIGTWSSGTYGAGSYAIGANLGSSVTAATITLASGAASFSAS